MSVILNVKLIGGRDPKIAPRKSCYTPTIVGESSAKIETLRCRDKVIVI